MSWQPGYASTRANLKNLQPFLARHWRKGVLGAALILFGSLLVFPQPLITRYLIDHVILAKQLDRLLWVVLLLAGAITAGIIYFLFLPGRDQLALRQSVLVACAVTTAQTVFTHVSHERN